MNDNEIIKALECCSKKDCKQCPCFDENIECGENLIKTSLDLINRQQAEIERLSEENNVMKTNCNSMCVSMPNIAKAERAEAVKEFAKRLKAEYADFDELHEEIRYDNLILAIDNLVKEMTEQSVNYGSSKTEGNERTILTGGTR